MRNRNEWYSIIVGLSIVLTGFTATFAIDEQFGKFMQAAQYDKALEYAEQKIPASSRDVETWVAMATAYRKNGAKFEQAKAGIEAAQKINPSDARVYEAFGDLYFDQKNFPDALKAFQRSYLLNNLPRTAEGIAVCAMRTNQPDMARDAAETALRLNPDLTEARSIMAQLSLKNKDYAAAVEHLTPMVAKKPGDLELIRSLAMACEKINDTIGLKKADARIVDLDKKDIISRQRLARASLAAHDTVTAYTLYKEIAILRPNDAMAFKNLYTIALIKNEKKDAAQYLKNYLLLDSSTVTDFALLGNLLYEQNDKTGALAAYRRAFKQAGIKGYLKNYADLAVAEKLDDEAIKVLTAAITAGEAEARHNAILGDLLKSRKQYAEAGKQYQEVLKADPKNVGALADLAECQAAAGDAKNAIISYEQVIQMKSGASTELRILGDLLMAANRADEAVVDYKKYLEAVPTDSRVAKIVGLREYAKKQYETTVKFLELVKDNAVWDIAYCAALGDAYYKMADCNKAIEWFAKARAQSPDNSVLEKILIPLGSCYQKNGKELEAADAYDAYGKIAAAAPNADATFFRAFLREKQQRETAAKMYETNIIKTPADYRNFYRLGLIYADDKTKTDRAISLLGRAVQLNDSLTDGWQTLGQLYAAGNNDDKELAVWQKLLTLTPTHVLANRRAGILQFKAKQFAPAITHLEAALVAAPKDRELIIILAQAYTAAKRPQDAAIQLAAAKAISPDDVKIRLDLIDAYKAAAQKESFDREIDQLAELDKKILARDRKNIESNFRLADYLLIRGQNDAAYEQYKQLAELQPKEAKIYKKLYDLAVKKGLKKEAIDHLRKYLAIVPDSPEPIKALAELLYDQKEFDAALTAYRQVAKLAPNLRGYYRHYVEIIITRNLEDDAVAVIPVAITAGEADVRAIVYLGDIYKKRKECQSAIKLYQEALKTETKNVGLLSSLAQCQADLGDNKNAIISYEQVVMMNSAAVREYKALGDLHSAGGKKGEAIAAYKRYLEKSGGDEAVAREVGLYEFDKQQYATAVKYLDMVKTPALQNIDWLTAIAMANYQQKSFAKAAELFARLRSLPTITPATLRTILPLLADCYEKTNSTLKAATTYDDYTAQKGVVNADASYKRAQLREQLGGDQRAEAIKIYGANTSLFPKDMRNFLRLGLLLADDKTALARAAALLTAASTVYDTNVIVFKTLAKIYNSQGNENAELAALKKYLTLQPADIDANRRAGAILLAKKQTSPALTYLEMASANAPQDIETMLLLAKGYIELNRLPQAADLLAKARAGRPGDIAIRDQLYKLYKQTGKTQEAETEIKGLIDLTKDNDYRLQYARDLIGALRYDVAQTVVQAVKTTDPMNVEGMMLLGTIQKAQKKFDDAIETYKALSYIKENYAPCISERGDAYLQMGNLDRAKEYFTKALSIDARYAPAELGLARVAKAQNNKADYQSHLAKAKALDPSLATEPAVTPAAPAKK